MTRRALLVRELFDAARARPAAERDAWLATSAQAHHGSPAAPDEAGAADDGPLPRGADPGLIDSDVVDPGLTDSGLIDAGVIDEVRQLLAFADRAGGPLDTPVLDAARLAASTAGRESDPVPDRIGPYQVVRALGRGSMGTVYEALQENPRRTVALKVLRAGAGSEAALRRFQLEVDALGRLDHPYVASIYEAGTTDLGATAGAPGESGGSRPYLAMEFVEGAPLSLAMRRQGLSLTQRLELLACIGEGVAHAHSRGVIHRDLKPDNVVVDGTLRPRILDFGVARLAQSEATVAGANATTAGTLVGTLQYMSPEQAAGDAARIDTRSDVYALGMLGYELLVGRTPYDLSELPLPEALRVITEDDGPAAGAVVPELRGDLETILAMALAKDPERRYPSAAEFASDIRRHLADEPILARPASSADQLRRFARKNRALVAGVSAGLVLLLGGLAAMAWGLALAHDRNLTNLQLLERERRALQAEQEARRQLQAEQAVSVAAREAAEQARASMQLALADAESLVDFVTGMIIAVHPRLGGWDVRMTAVLDDAAARAADWQLTAPVRARVDETLGRAYMGLGRYADGRDHLRRAFETWRALRGPDAPETLGAQRHLGESLRAAFEHEAARALLADLVERSQRVHGADAAPTWDARIRLGVTLRDLGALDEASAVLSALVATATPAASGAGNAVQREPAGRVEAGAVEGGEGGPGESAGSVGEGGTGAESAPARRDVLRMEARYELARVHYSAGRYDEARSAFTEVVAARRAVWGADHIETLNARGDLAQLESTLGHLDAGVAAMEAVHAGLCRTLGPDHPEAWERLAELATAHARSGRHGEALEEFEAAVDGLSRQVGPGDVRTLQARRQQAGLFYQLDRLDEAQATLDAIIDVAAGVPALVDDLLSARRLRGTIRMRRADHGGARAELEQTLAAMREHLGPRHIEVAHVLSALANIDAIERRMGAREQHLLQAEAIYRERLPTDHPQLLAVRMNRARGYLISGRAELGVPLLVETIEQLHASGAGDQPQCLRGVVWLAEAWVREGHGEQALPLLDGALESLLPQFGSLHELVSAARRARIDALTNADRLDEAWAALDELGQELHDAYGVIGVDMAAPTARWFRASGRLAEAANVLQGAIDTARDAGASGLGVLWELRYERARVLALDGLLPEALGELHRAHAETAGAWGEQAWELRRTAAALAELYAEQGRAAEAAAWGARACLTEDAQTSFLEG